MCLRSSRTLLTPPGSPQLDDVTAACRGLRHHGGGWWSQARIGAHSLKSWCQTDGGSPKEVGAASVLIGQASRAVFETEPEQSDGLPGCV